MEFNDNRPIYLQIYDNICEQILTGALKPDEILGLKPEELIVSQPFSGETL